MAQPQVEVLSVEHTSSALLYDNVWFFFFRWRYFRVLLFLLCPVKKDFRPRLSTQTISSRQLCRGE